MGRVLQGWGWVAAIAPLEIDDLALGEAQQQRLRNPLVVDVGLAHIFHQVFSILFRACESPECSLSLYLLTAHLFIGGEAHAMCQMPGYTEGMLGAES